MVKTNLRRCLHYITGGYNMEPLFTICLHFDSK